MGAAKTRRGTTMEKPGWSADLLLVTKVHSQDDLWWMKDFPEGSFFDAINVANGEKIERILNICVDEEWDYLPAG